jgi:hypothetical protein
VAPLQNLIFSWGFTFKDGESIRRSLITIGEKSLCSRPGAAPFLPAGDILQKNFNFLDEYFIFKITYILYKDI